MTPSSGQSLRSSTATGPRSIKTNLNQYKYDVTCYVQYPRSYIYQSSESTEVYWGHSSILEAELLCLSDLLNNNRSWHYAINLAGSEMMSISNKKLVARLSPEPRKIHVSSFPFPAKLRWKVDRKYELGEEEAVFDPDGSLRSSLAGSIDLTPGPRGQLMNMVRVVDPVNDPPPFNLSLFKGIKSYRLPRWFVTFLLTHPVAKEFINWTMNTIHPEEHTVQTLARNISHLTFQP